jgi:hypothetical protein
MKKIIAMLSLCLLGLSVQMSYAENANISEEVKTTTASPELGMTALDIQQAMELMQTRLDTRIQRFGQTLKANDFERSWTGRTLNKAKRQEVCGIFQGVVDETFQLFYTQQPSVNENEQMLVEKRQIFLEKLGFQNNIVDTRMGFNCRIR